MVLLFLIRLYQKTLSPDSGWWRHRYPAGYCRFYPHCSEYGYQAIDKHGPLKGLALTSWRIVRCNPLSKGGNDPVT